MGWKTILLLTSISGAFGGMLDVLQIIDVRKLIERPETPIASWRRFIAALALGAIGGVGGAVAMLFVIVATAKLDTSDTPANVLMLCSLSMVSGFLGYRVLSSVARRVENQIKEAEARTEKKIEETTAQTVAIVDKKIQQSSKYANAISKGLLVAGSLEVPPFVIEDAIAEIEEIIKRTPDDRQASIVLSNIYSSQENYDKAIDVLNDLMKTLQNKGESRNIDMGDALYNRACILNTKAKGLPEGSPELNELKKKIYADLAASFRLSPTNKEEAKKDPDLESLRAEEQFINLTG